MKSKKTLRLFSVLVAIFVIAGFGQGCKSTTTGTAQSLVYNLATDSKSIDVSLNNSVDGSNVINACFEGLTRINEKMVPGPGVAKSWDISKDGKTYTFHLRNDAKWSDGKAVTANDFYFSWSRLLNPVTAAEYSYQMFYLKNAEEYFNKKAKLSDVGIKVVDDSTFQATLKAPIPYFLELCAWSAFAPQRADIVNANPLGWATNPATYIGNGPFKLTSWVHNDSMDFVKNTNYWNAGNIKLDKMKWVMINEASSYMIAWEKGDVDIIESPSESEIPKLLADKKLTVTPYLGSYCLYVNTAKAPFDNVKFRKALTLAIDRDFITKSILKAGQLPAGAWVPTGMLEPNGKDFRDTPKQYFPPGGDVAQARQLLKDSGVSTKNLTVEYLYNTSEAHKKIAEAIQQMWKTNLGLNVKLANQEWSVFQATRKAGNYQIARAGWIGDYSDPMTFLDMFTSNSGQNDPKYKNPQYDALIASAKAEVDTTKRMNIMHAAENILMADMPIIPIYFYVNTLCISKKVTGLYKTLTGTLYFDKVVIK